MKKLRILSIIIAGCIIVYTLTGFFAIPMILESMLPERLGEQLHRKVSLGKVYLNPYTLTLAAEGFAVKEKTGGRDFVRFDRMMIDVEGLSSVRQKGLVIKALNLEKPYVHIARRSDSRFNFSDLLDIGQGQKHQKPVSRTKASAKKSKEVPFLLIVDSLKINAGSVRFHDDSAGGAAKRAGRKPVDLGLGPINLDVTDFSTARNADGRFKIATRINKQGTIKLDGKLGISPLKADAAIRIKGLAFAWAQQYLPEHIRLAVTDGKLSYSGKLTLNESKSGRIRTTLTGDASVRDVKTINRINAEDFISLSDLSVRGIHFTYPSLNVALKEIGLKGLDSRIVRESDGRLNVAAIFVSSRAGTESETAAGQKTAPPASDEKSPAVPIRINKVSLKNIKTAFVDRMIKPNFSASLVFSEGRITGLEPENFQAADLRIKGSVNDSAPVAISGKINPLAKNLFADIALKLDHMEMSLLTPYTGRYVGKAVKQGKLNLDLKYRIRENALDADNRILLDQFTLGRDIKSPDAINLPVGLAIALLKDRNGRIDLDIPVSGRLDDPSFKPGGIILQAVYNIVKKAATSPFDLVAAVVSGGAELSVITFDPGSDALTEKGRKKLDTVATLLYERPGLRLGITGYVDPVRDREKLTDLAFERKIKARKRLLMVKKGGPAPELEKITVQPDEFEALLKTVYTAEQITASGKENPKEEKGLSVEEMKRRLREHVTVSDDELRLLATRRARHVKTYILKDQRIDPGRVFVVEGETLSPSEKDETTGSRAELSLSAL